MKLQLNKTINCSFVNEVLLTTLSINTNSYTESRKWPSTVENILEHLAEHLLLWDDVSDR